MAEQTALEGQVGRFIIAVHRILVALTLVELIRRLGGREGERARLVSRLNPAVESERADETTSRRFY